MNGERGQRGKTGKTGQTGERGPSRRYGPLYGYIVASVIFTAIIYALLFQVHSDNIKNCELRNQSFQEVNDRTAKFNALFKVERLEPDHADARHLLVPVQNVTLTECDEAFSHPWPF